MLRSLTAAALLGALSLAGASSAHEAPVTPAPEAPSPSGPEWQMFSRSSQTAFLVDPSTIAEQNGVTSIQMARAPLNPAQGEPGWTLETYEFRCSSSEYRMTTMADFGLDGSPAAPPETLEESFEPVSAGGLSGHLKGVACDNQRVRPPHYASIQAWIDGGRK